MSCIQHDVGIQAAHGAAELVIFHRYRALGALHAVGTHSPAQARIAAVERVLLVEHVAHIAKRHARAFLAEAPERHIGEIAVCVGCRPVEQHVGPKPVAAAHAGHHHAAELHQSIGHRMHMGRVALVKLHHAPIAALEHHHIHPAAVPHFGRAHFLVRRVEPAVFGHRELSRHVKSPVQARAATTKLRVVVGAPPANARLPKAANQLLVLGEHARQAAGVHPALSAQPSRIAQVVLHAGPVPVDLVAVHWRALVGKAKRIIALDDLGPAQSHGNLRVEGLGARIVGLAVALCLVEFEADRVRHVLAARLPVGCHTPVGAVGFLIAADSLQGRANQVLHARGNAQLSLRFQQLRAQLVALGVVHFLVGNGAPLTRLVVDFVVDVAVLVDSQLAIWRVHGV